LNARDAPEGGELVLETAQRRARRRIRHAARRPGLGILRGGDRERYRTTWAV